VLNVPQNEEVAVELIQSGITDYTMQSMSLSPEILVQALRRAIRIHRAEMQVELVNKQLTRQLQEMERQQQYIDSQNLKILAATGLKSQFLATISHELRTPMNAIIGFSQILLRGKFTQLTHQQADMVERILANGQHLLTLVNEILDFAKLEAGKLELNLEIFDLSDLVNSTVAEIYPEAAAKKLSLLVQNDLKNTLVFNDPVRVRQILTNLLSNAIKFTESGGIWVEMIEMSPNSVVIIVRDTGIGIPPQDQERIFEAFCQADQSMTRKYPGTGLGLAIIHALLRVMGGKIFLESQFGVGSVFQVELPRQVKLTPSSVGGLDLSQIDFNANSNRVFYATPNLPQSNYPSTQASKMGYLKLKS
jgi:signal transduction histidine kinase